MQISAIHSFLLLCEEKNITKCSEKMHITHQGLSRQIRAMEQELGVTLFTRSRSGLELTEEGKVVEPMLRAVWEDYERMQRNLAEYRKKHQTVLSVAVCPGIKNALGLDFFMRFQQKNPGIRLDLRFKSDGDCEELLHSGKVDAAFLDWPCYTEEYDSYLVVKSRLVAVFRKEDPLAELEEVSMKNLVGRSVYIPDETHRMHQRFRQNWPELYHSVRIDFTSNDYESFYNELPKAMGGVALTFSFLCHHLDPDLKVMTIQEPSYVELSYCVMNQRTETPELHRFSEYVYRNIPKVIE